jgi:Pentapeptide repeats (9 copies)/Pentapeptide repeats (8 copies)
MSRQGADLEVAYRPGANNRLPSRIISGRAAVFAVVAVAVSASVTIFVLLTIAGKNAGLRIEAIKVGLSVGGAVGAAAALLLAFRRQWHAEHVAQATNYDATERRVNELYAKAVEELGHQRAAVRLGGLYALARLAQDNFEHRQTVVDVICAYLRMPFELLPDDQQLDSENGTGIGPGAERLGSEDPRQELQVRLAAQRVLERHLFCPIPASPLEREPKPSTYWNKMSIDLAGAHLIGVNFSGCRLYDADFSEAHFSEGPKRFIGAPFVGTLFGRQTSFYRARFDQITWFIGAKFTDTVRFEESEFKRDVLFNGVKFWHGITSFGGVKFDAAVKFTGADFRSNVTFYEAQFRVEPEFMKATAIYPNDRHIWPQGWQLQPESPGVTEAVVVQEHPEESSPRKNDHGNAVSSPAVNIPAAVNPSVGQIAPTTININEGSGQEVSGP